VKINQLINVHVSFNIEKNEITLTGNYQSMNPSLSSSLLTSLGNGSSEIGSSFLDPEEPDLPLNAKMPDFAAAM
jgi:hypothetical protein